MTNKTCPLEVLVMTEYCRLTVCPECGVVHLNLPARVSFQFDMYQFLEIANAFTRAAQMLKGDTTHIHKAKVIEFDRKH